VPYYAAFFGPRKRWLEAVAGGAMTLPLPNQLHDRAVSENNIRFLLQGVIVVL